MTENVKKYPSKKVFFDYGGANVAKALHVGHLRTANIGEALKRLTKLVGNEVMSDVHLGDIGRQSAYRGIQRELSAPRSYPTGADRSRTTLRQAACGWRHSRTGRTRRQDNNLQVPADAYEG